MVVVGAGVVGLACARALALTGREVLMLESARSFGTGISSRSSEVIHAGLYYPGGSLKAHHCVAGKRMLYDYCATRGIGFRRCGKLLVATEESQIAQLQTLFSNAVGNGVEDLQIIDATGARAMEPALRCAAALLSPSSGIIDSHAYMLALLGDFENAGGIAVFNTKVTGGQVSEAGIAINIGEADLVQARLLVNCAGLGAQTVAHAIDGFPVAHISCLRYARGSYFSISAKSPFSHLIYPIPGTAGLGIHLTIDMAGQAKFGPDVEWIAQPSYAVDASRADAFKCEISKYWPGIEDHVLQPAYAGIRPKINAPGEPAADFYIGGRQAHGVRGIINLFGIESPGLTASLSIAHQVNDLAAIDAS